MPLCQKALRICFDEKISRDCFFLFLLDFAVNRSRRFREYTNGVFLHKELEFRLFCIFGFYLTKLSKKRASWCVLRQFS